MTNAILFDQYARLDNHTCEERIIAAKRTLGPELIILSHHYQRDEVFRHADFSGDSLKLSRRAATSQARNIVFCGVHFMAEVADILSRPDQVSILPDLTAGCSMADMANLVKVEQVWRELSTLMDDPNETVTPVTYINSSADLKAFCGRHGGIVCTSSNARSILDWAFSRREKVLFFPDQHLGRNTGYAMGIPLAKMVVWDPDLPLGGLTELMIREARILLWKGFCSVHQVFQPEHIDAFRIRFPDIKVISHPECSFEVCQKSDSVGSTEYIIRAILDSAPGSRWLVGTEFNLVNRLHEQCLTQEKHVHFMSPTICFCSTMFRIDPQHLLWTLENLVAGQIVNRIQVPTPVADQARQALNLMLEISAS
ncbi:Quinolinate synthase A [Gammaproteobacteria bacterium]